jgi:DNA invertase Pin-like site-specific DNA recombinase
LGKVREWLEPVFASVADPFPDHEKLGGANISRGTIDRIIELYTAGDRVSLIAEKLNLSPETVRRWVNRHQIGRMQGSVPVQAADESGGVPGGTSAASAG